MKTTETKLSKKSVLRTLKDLPDTFAADDLIERLLLLQAVERGMADVKKGRVRTQAEAKAILATRWRK